MPVWVATILTYLASKINLFDLGFFIAANLRVPYVKKIKLSDAQIKELESKLQHADLIFGRRNWFLKNRIVPGFYKHVGVWNASKRVVMEFQDSGYEENTLRTFLSRYTNVGVGSPDFTPEYRTKFISKLETFCEKKYDNKFSRNVESMYCSEAVYDADVDRILRYEPTKVLWLEVFVPNELLSLPSVKQTITITQPNIINYF